MMKIMRNFPRVLKDNYWILWKNNDGSFVRLPKPKDLAGLFSADFERGLEVAFNKKGPEAFDGFFIDYIKFISTAYGHDIKTE